MASVTRTSGLSRLFESQRGRILLENLTAYLFLTPAVLIIFIFGVFPVAFAFFVSLHRWRRFPDSFQGLDQYSEALGSIAYVVFFWLAIGAVVLGVFQLVRLWRETRSQRSGLLAVLPGTLLTLAIGAFVHWFFMLLPLILNVPVRLRGQEITRELFIDEFFSSFRFPELLAAADTMWLALLAAIAASAAYSALVRINQRGHLLSVATIGGVLIMGGLLLLQLTLAEIQLAIETAQAAGEALPVWSQVIIISAGVGLLFAAYRAWRAAARAYSDRNFVLSALAAVLLIIGGYALVTQLPPALALADRDVLQGFNVTVMYSLGTVPLQLAIGIGLAVLLFRNIRGKSFFRMIYFLPYITPFVATSLIFTLIFSHRSGSPANQLLGIFGIPEQDWLLEPQGVFELIFGAGVPEPLGGPGLALVVMILYNTWTYAGYSTVIFLAGLGQIPKELHEAARIDGANGWQEFRHITLPLLSPTTFFLVLISTIGTFQAFTQIYLMRRPGALQAVDTINIYIFEEINATNPDYAYGSAMAFVLFGVILILTIVQNRIAQRRVFYG